MIPLDMSTPPFIRIMRGNGRGMRTTMTRRTGIRDVLEETAEVEDVAEQAGIQRLLN